MTDIELGSSAAGLGNGSTYDHARDGKRLSMQRNRVLAFMRRGAWHTLSEISRRTGDPESSVSARLRQLRKEGFTIQRRYVSRGLHEYRLAAQLELLS